MPSSAQPPHAAQKPRIWLRVREGEPGVFGNLSRFGAGDDMERNYSKRPALCLIILPPGGRFSPSGSLAASIKPQKPETSSYGVISNTTPP
jgi:hypothetical protein